MKNKNVLIVGGSSGLGLEMGKIFSEKGAVIYATGQSQTKLPFGLRFLPLRVTEHLTRLSEDLDEIVADLPPIDVFVHAAGFSEKGHLADLSDAHMAKVLNLGILAPAMLLQRILKKQKALEGFIAITSTSQWIPRELEPLYTASKAGLAMLAQSASLDPSIGKTLVAGPAGMGTPFWRNTSRDLAGLLDPKWVAEQIMALWVAPCRYRLARILRNPARVEILETK